MFNLEGESSTVRTEDTVHVQPRLHLVEKQTKTVMPTDLEMRDHCYDFVLKWPWIQASKALLWMLF